MATIFGGGIYFFGKPGDINDELDKVHTSDAVTTVRHGHKLQLLSPAVSRGIKLYNTICPSASPLTIIKNHMDICAHVPHVVATDTTRGRCLFHSELLIVWLLFEGGIYSMFSPKG